MTDFLFLFDIDGTILDSNGYGKKAFIESFEKLFNKKIDFDVSFLGGIDNVIFKQLYQKFKLNNKYINIYWEKFKKEYLLILQEYSDTREWSLYPNVYETVSYLSKYSNVSIATGNIKKGAEIKLKKFNLLGFFPVGGYGDKAIDRVDFIYDSIRESEKKYNKKFKLQNIYLFGDTELDVKSANQCGINSVLIDHNEKYKKSALNWNTKYYGNFKSIDKFMKLISLQEKINHKKIYFF
ncbi:MAG: HAD hydrolase-like protein [Spirochaetes bacterium]|nr:HAD hydrolase-like protein [Spirochaetota bacterium]